MQPNLNKSILFHSFFLFFVLFSTSQIAFGQNNDLQMAQYYYEQSDFGKAKLYYEKLYSPSSSQDIYNQYINTLTELKEFSEAQKITKKRIKNENFGAFYKIKLGEIYELEGEQNKANSYFESLIDDLNKKNTVSEYNLYANEFVRILKYEFAISVFEKCDKTHDNSNHKISIANLHGFLGNHELMIETYLDQIVISPNQVQYVKAILPRSINFLENESIVTLLKKQTLKKIQKNPENESMYDLLIWIFQQSNDFENAYIQVNALDKRTKKNGEKIYEFGQMCSSNKKYDLALEAFEYCIEKYNKSDFSYIASKRAILQTLQLKIFAHANYSKMDLVNLKNRYLKTLEETRETEDKFSVLQGLAYLEGFYLHNTDTAEIIYKQLLNFPGINDKQKGKVKVELADIYMLNNEIWDASLLYMQVEKKFKHDVIGSEAKYKNAKLYYYNGDFEWAQNQLDGLKASTSKLISNDAIDLSLLITDNYNMDTTPLNMKQFAQADLLIFQNKFSEAELLFDSILSRNSSHSLVDEIAFKKYEIAYKKQDFKLAEKHLNSILSNYADGILADNALFKLAELNENQLNDSRKAMSFYEKLIFEYPGSLFVIESRKRYRAYQEEFPSDTIQTIVK